MDPQVFLRILAPYLHMVDVNGRKEILQQVALAMEEYGEKTYNEIRAILRTHTVELPIEMCCKECKKDDDDTILTCDWCGRYYHSKCSKYNSYYCSKQCSTIDQH